MFMIFFRDISGAFFGNKERALMLSMPPIPWGQSVASLVYRADKANGLVDYNAYQLASLKPGKNVTILTDLILQQVLH